MQNVGGGWRELEAWLRASVAEAERELPDLLDLPAAVLRREVAARPELQTAGVLQAVIALAHDALDRYPRRAYELTSMLVELAPRIEASGERAVLVARLHALAWKEHARALSALNRPDEAREALHTARRVFGNTPAHDWYLATVDLLEAPLVQEAGDRNGALALVRRAAAEFALYHDYELLVEARMLEMWMHWDAGDDEAVTGVWTSTAELASLRRHPTLLARLASKAARLHLRRGDAVAAARLLEQAAKVFDEEGLTQEAVRTRWNLAEASTARGRLHEAISEFHKVRATLLATGSVIDAAIASTEIVELLLIACRGDEVPTLLESFLAAFRTLLTQNALEAFTFLHARATTGTITPADTAAVRRYFEDLRQQPHARFRPPD